MQYPIDAGSRHTHGLPRWLSCKESACQCRGHRFDPWVGKIPWRRDWQPTPIFLPRESHGQRSLVGCYQWGCKESHTTEHAHMQTPTNIQTHTHLYSVFKVFYLGPSLVVQWLRICLPMQVTWVQSLIGELKSHIPWRNCLASHSYWAMCNGSLHTPEPGLCNQRSPHNEKPGHRPGE